MYRRLCVDLFGLFSSEPHSKIQISHRGAAVGKQPCSSVREAVAVFPGDEVELMLSSLESLTEISPTPVKKVFGCFFVGSSLGQKVSLYFTETGEISQSVLKTS